MPNLTDVLEGEDRQTIRNMIYGYKNILINGCKRVNQRTYAGGVLADGVYGYDRWKGANSDVNIEQVIEQQNINSGTYTISWVGGGTATVGATSGLASGDSVVLTVSGNISVKVPKGATNIQLEEGLKATPFEQRPIGLEISLCKRYYEKEVREHLLYGYMASSGLIAGNTPTCDIRYSVEKRVTPSLTINVTGFTLGALRSTTKDGFSVLGSAVVSLPSIDSWIADAEI
jgi:hypothetical protein